MPFNRPIPDSRPSANIASGIKGLVEAEKLMQIAILLPASAFIGWLLGSWADHSLHQSWIGLAGVVFGGIAGLVHVVRLALSAERHTAPDEQEEPAAKDRKESPDIKP